MDDVRVHHAEVSTFGQWLRDVRISRGLSQEQVAQRAAIAVTTYGRIERNDNGGRWANPQLTTLISLLRALDVDTAELHDCVERLLGI